MKKSIFSLMIGTIVALSSCGKSDNMSTSPQEGDQLAIFTVETSNLTRATVDDLTRYIVEAYENDDLNVAPLRVESANGTLELTLKKNTDYTFLFWADKGVANANTKYWDATKLQEVKVAAGKENTIGEVAYCLAVSFNSRNFEMNKAVKLKNATAQVNFIESVGLATVNNTLKVTYNKSAKLNVATGKITDVTNNVEHTFTNITQAAANATIATDYMLSPLGEKNVLNLKMQFNSEPEKSLSNVPLEQNFKTNITGEYSNIYTSVFTISNQVDDSENNPDIELNNKNFKVGDLYPNSTAPIGVVFWIDDTDPKYDAIAKTSTKGKIISLDEITNVEWSIVRDDTDGNSFTNGLENTDKVLNLSTYNDTDYYAFKWCNDKNSPENTNIRWYIPAKEELKTLYGNYTSGTDTNVDSNIKNIVNISLNAANATQLSPLTYWSSSQNNSGSVCWSVNFDNGYTYSYDKTNKYKVRCVSKILK